jgi:hypothetical protein
MSSTFVDGVTPLDAAHLNALQAKSEKAAASGYASLDATGKVPVAQLPAYPTGIPPVVNGQWLKGQGGAAVWSAIASADISGLVTPYIPNAGPIQSPGAFPFTLNVTLPRAIIDGYLMCWGSCFANVPGQILVGFNIDGGSISYAASYRDGAGGGRHMLVPGAKRLTNLAAGAHSVNFSAGTNVTSDIGDYWTLLFIGT